jgi:hypothetical protein
MKQPWRTLAAVRLDPLPPDWRADLTHLLGERPRRLGAWTELALYGALRCRQAAGETTLPAGTALRLASLSGPATATADLLTQAHQGGPMPFTFLQSQPSQMLAALARALRWQGDARFVLCRDHAALTTLAQLEARGDDLLLGWVEEDRATRWTWHRRGP